MPEINVVATMSRFRVWYVCFVATSGELKVAARKVAAPKGGEAQNFALFFLSPAGNFNFFPSLGSSRGILVV